MRFELTPDEAQRAARAMIKHFKKHGMRVKVEAPAWSEAPYTTTLVAEKAGRHVLVEAQGTVSYGRSLKELVTWLAVRRHYAETYIATSGEAVIPGAGVLHEMRVDGVGLFFVSDTGVVTQQHRARNAALVVTPEPTLKYGSEKAAVEAALSKFNEVDRKDGLRDMCEIVERATEEVGVAACRKGLLIMDERVFREQKDWAGQINELARKEAYNSAHQPLVSATLKDDLHSFRGARNLVDHKARSRREDVRRERQFAERMVQGPRLVADLVSLRRKIR